MKRTFKPYQSRGRNLDDYTLGNYIAKGSYGAVFNVKLKVSETDPNFCLDKSFDKSCELVIKQLFNYGAG